MKLAQRRLIYLFPTSDSQWVIQYSVARKGRGNPLGYSMGYSIFCGEEGQQESFREALVPCYLYKTFDRFPYGFIQLSLRPDLSWMIKSSLQTCVLGTFLNAKGITLHLPPPFFIVPHWNHVKINCSANRINLTTPSRLPALNSHNKNELDLEVILRTWHGEPTVEGVICLSQLGARLNCYKHMLVSRTVDMAETRMLDLKVLDNLSIIHEEHPQKMNAS